MGGGCTKNSVGKEDETNLFDHFFLKEPPIFHAVKNSKNASSVQFVGLTVDIMDVLAKYLNFT